MQMPTSTDQSPRWVVRTPGRHPRVTHDDPTDEPSRSVITWVLFGAGHTALTPLQEHGTLRMQGRAPVPFAAACFAPGCFHLPPFSGERPPEQERAARCFPMELELRCCLSQ